MWEPRLKAQEGGGHAQDVDPAAGLQRVHHVALAHTSQLPLQVPAQPPRQPRVPERPECAHKARHDAKEGEVQRHCRPILRG